MTPSTRALGVLEIEFYDSCGCHVRKFKANTARAGPMSGEMKTKSINRSNKVKVFG